MTGTKKTDKFNFEKSLEKLNSLVNTMEQDNLSLEDSLKNFEDGVILIRDCQKALSTAEQKVQILSQSKDQLEDFNQDD